MSAGCRVFWLSLAVLIGCGESSMDTTSSDTGLVLKKLRVRDDTPTDLRPVGVPAQELEDILRLALSLEGMTERPTHARWLFGPVGPEGGWSISVSSRVVYGIVLPRGLADTVTPGEVKAVLTAEARIRAPSRPDAVTYYLEADSTGPFSGDAGTLKQALGTQIGEAAVRLAERLSNRLVLVGKSPRALLEGVSAESAETRLAVVEQLAQLRAKEAVPTLAKRLKDEKEAVVKLRIVGALAEMADARAAPALIAAADPKDRVLFRACIDALSVVGGQRVDDFLDILAAHDAPDIREMVETAQARRIRLKESR